MIFRVIDIKTEPLQPDQVVDGLPDHAAYWHRAHDSQQDDDGIAVDVHTRSTGAHNMRQSVPRGKPAVFGLNR